MREELKLKVSLLPVSPGVYRYKNREGTIIYVGKAKNLKRRVSSYFNRVHSVLRTNMLVKNIWDMEYTVVNSEEEALDLENSLIKEYQPHYNVLLKDDKSYPWICVTKELYPRVFMTRDTKSRGAKYFGPYPKTEVAHALIDVIRKIFPVRTCRHNITADTIEQRKNRLCLQFHIKNCEGCCQGLVSADKYAEYIDEIKHILNGDTKQVSDYLVAEMQRLASELQFEQANEVKRKYLAVEKYRARSVIVNPSIHNIDVFSMVRDASAAYFNFMHMRNGSVVQSLNLEYKLRQSEEDEPTEELMSIAINDIHKRFAASYGKEKVKEALVNVVPDTAIEGLEFVVPQRGDKRKLLDISLKNALQYKADKYKRMEKLNPEQREMRPLTQMQKDLRINCRPRHIECFDKSNIAGSDRVESCVVFRNGKPSKKEYRHFNINTVEGPDDYASMREVLNRRYSRLLAEGEELPQLVVVDGGKGQLNAAIEAFDEVGVRDKIAAIGIAKRLDEIYYPGDEIPLYIDKNSETLAVIQRLRDEAHRFGIKHHRSRRSKSQIHSVLDDIQGIGPKTQQALLKHFKSVKRVSEASLADIQAVIGKAKGNVVYNVLNNKSIGEK